MCLQQHPLVGSVCSDASPGSPAVEAGNVCCFSSTRSLISPVGNRLTLGSSLITYLLRAGGFPCRLIDSNPDPIQFCAENGTGNSFLQIKEKDALTTNTVLRALACIQAQIPGLLAFFG